MQRLQCHNHLSGRTVRVRDDVLLGIAINRFGVTLGHNQRHVRIITIERRVIDDDAAGGCSLGCIFLGRTRAHGEQRHVPAREIEGVQVLCLQSLFAKADFGAKRPARRQHGNLVYRELTLRENVQHFAAHIPRGTCDNDFIAHLDDSFRLGRRRIPQPRRGAKRNAMMACIKVSDAMARFGHWRPIVRGPSPSGPAQRDKRPARSPERPDRTQRSPGRGPPTRLRPPGRSALSPAAPARPRPWRRS